MTVNGRRRLCFGRWYASAGSGADLLYQAVCTSRERVQMRPTTELEVRKLEMIDADV